jgi:hypothetical protein
LLGLDADAAGLQRVPHLSRQIGKLQLHGVHGRHNDAPDV